MTDTTGHPVTLIAHRGYSAKAPENTLAAIKAATAVAADGIEWDMSTTACGTPVLFHDVTLERTTNGRGSLADTRWAELSTLDAGSWFGEAFAGERVPSLQQACETLAGWSYAGTVVAEIKGWSRPEHVDRMVDVFRETGMEDQVRYIAIDWAAIDRVAEVAPEARVAFIVERVERWGEGLERARSLKGAGLAVDYRILLDDPGRVDAAFESGIPVGVWTVDDPAEAGKLYDLGIRDFTTNEVERLETWKDGL